MITGLFLGAGVGAGVALIVRSVRSRRPPLAVALARLEATHVPPASAGGNVPVLERLGHRVLGGFSGASAARPADLRITGRTPERHVAEQLVAAIAGLALPPVLALLLAANGIALPAGVVGVVSLLLTVGGWLLPNQLLRDAARHRRDELRHALSGFLDLVNVILAGGAGIETALDSAADAGDGWAFAELRAALARARLTRSSPWDAFVRLGEELDVPELVELGAAVRLAGEQGARIKGSLAAKAASLRGHQLARVEADAQAASERMALPTVLLFTGFLLFIGYPAVAQILGGRAL